MHREFDPDDYSVVVKLRGNPPKPWRWEIYCAGKRQPIEQSEERFESRAAAQKAGRAVFKQLIAKLSV